MDFRTFLIAAVSALIGSIGQIEFKKGSEFEFNISALLVNYHLITGVMLYALSTLVYLYALREGQLSIIYPIIATSYIWTTIFAKVFLGESVDLMNWIGIFLILLGVTIVSWK
jgi:uncharacterized membrane protein